MQDAIEEKTSKEKKFFKNQLDKKILYGLFSEYLILIIWVIALKFNSEWVPKLGEYFRSLPLKDRIKTTVIPFYGMIKNGFRFNADYFSNVLIYIPLGIFLSFFLEKKTFLNIAIILFSSIIFEAIQLLTGFGGSDVTDVFCNLSGGVIGLILYALLRKRIKDKTINVITFFLFVCFLPVTVYAVSNTALNWRLYLIY